MRALIKPSDLYNSAGKEQGNFSLSKVVVRMSRILRFLLSNKKDVPYSNEQSCWDYYSFVEIKNDRAHTSHLPSDKQ